MAQRAIVPEPARNAAEVEAAYAAVPEGAPVKAEILEGVLQMMNRPNTRHQRIALRLARVVANRYEDGHHEGEPRWLFLQEPELHLGLRPDKLQPDISGWHRERLVREPDGASITIPPDWVCEVLSDSTEDNDRRRKWRIFRREGVRHYWLIDPESQTLEAHELRDGDYQLIGEYRGTPKVRVAPFEGLEIELDALWRW